MKKNHYSSFVLIGIGLYFFIIQLNHPLIQKLNTWSVLVIAIGIWLILHYLKEKNQHSFIQGLTILFIGIHFYGVDHFHNWFNHWAIFPLAWGVALLIAYIITKKYLKQSIGIIGFALLFIFSDKLPDWFPSLEVIESRIIAHWPLLLIGLGVFLYIFKRK